MKKLLFLLAIAAFNCFAAGPFGSSSPVMLVDPVTLLGYAAGTPATATGSGTITTQNLVPGGAATANSAVEVTITGNSSLTVQVTGTYTAAGGLSAQATVDGTNWTTICSSVCATTFKRNTTGASTAAITSGEQDVYTISFPAGALKVRVTALGAVTGTATVTQQGAASGGGAGGGGTSDATAANQVSTNTKLDTLHTDLTTANTQLPPANGTQSIANSMSVTPATAATFPISAASLPLPSGAATSANQTPGSATAYSDASRLPVDERDGVAVTTVSVAAAAATATATFTNGSPNIGWTTHGFAVNQAVFFTTSGTLPTNFAVGSATTVNYYVKTVVDANTFTVSATPGGTAITAGSAGSGTQTGTAINNLYVQDMTGYESLSNQIISAGTTCTVTYETSDDAQNWVAWQGFPAVANSGTGNSSSSTTAVMTKFGKWGKYSRARVSTYTSGTVTGVGTLHKAPFNAQVAVSTSSGFTVAGTGAHASAVTGNPTMLGVEAYTAAPTAVTTGQTSRAWGTTYGSLIVRQDSIPELEWSYAAATGGITNTTTAVTIKAAGAQRLYLRSLDIMCEALGAATEIAVRDGAGGTVLWRTKVGTAGLPWSHYVMSPARRGTAATLMEVVTLTASITGACYVNAAGQDLP